MSHHLSPKRRLRDNLLKVLLYTCAALTCCLLMIIIGAILWRGLGNLSWKLLTSQTSYLADTIGIFPNILNTLYIILVSMGDCGKLYSIYDQNFVTGMREFCRGADVITPNLTEATLLAGIPFEGDQFESSQISAVFERLSALDIKKVVLTGVRFGASEIGVVAFDSESRASYTFKTPFADTYLHGTGDTFASSLCARMLQGRSFPDAIRDALDFTFASIRNTIQTDSRYGLIFEPELYRLAR